MLNILETVNVNSTEGLNTDLDFETLLNNSLLLEDTSVGTSGVWTTKTKNISLNLTFDYILDTNIDLELVPTKMLDYFKTSLTEDYESSLRNTLWSLTSSLKICKNSNGEFVVEYNHTDISTLDPIPNTVINSISLTY